jgi:hypothetical protein
MVLSAMPAYELDWSEKLREVVIFVFILCCIGVVFIGIGGLIYSGLNDMGWIPHTRVVTVSLKSSSWIVGEYKDCHSPAQQNVTHLSCDESSETHDLKVTFWGANRSNVQPEITWNCQRAVDLLTREESLICKRR